MALALMSPANRWPLSINLRVSHLQPHGVISATHLGPDGHPKISSILNYNALSSREDDIDMGMVVSEISHSTSNGMILIDPDTLEVSGKGIDGENHIAVHNDWAHETVDQQVLEARDSHDAAEIVGTDEDSAKSQYDKRVANLESSNVEIFMEDSMMLDNISQQMTEQVEDPMQSVDNTETQKTTESARDTKVKSFLNSIVSSCVLHSLTLCVYRLTPSK